MRREDAPEFLPEVRSMLHRPAILLGYIWALLLAASTIDAGTTTSLPVVGVDIEKLLGVLCGGEQVSKTDPPFQRGSFVFVGLRCYEADTDRQFGLGIYGDASIAQQALGRGEPSAPGSIHPPLGDQHYVSATGIHVRVDNVILFIPKGVPGNLPVLAEKVVQILDDGSILRRGEIINKPFVEIVSFNKDGNGNFTVALRVQDAPDVFVDYGQSIGSDEYIVKANRFFMDAEFSIRAARPTGEFVVIPESCFPEEARIDSVNALDEPEVNYEFHLAALQTSTGPEKARHLRALADRGIPELQPVFEEILGGASHAAVKKHALRGLAKIQQADGIDSYRQIAADAEQPELIRRDAVDLVRTYGSRQDLGLLREIANSTSEMEDLAAALGWAIRQLSGEPEE